MFKKFTFLIFTIFLASLSVDYLFAKSYLETHVVKVKKGDTLSTILKNKGVNPKEVIQALNSLKKIYRPATKLKVGHTLALSLENQEESQKKSIKKLVLPLSFSQEVRLIKNNDGHFKSKKIDRPIETNVIFREATINNSLFGDGNAIGIPDQILYQLVKQFSYEVDFQREVKKGDKFSVYFEELYDPSFHKFVPGDLLYASLTLSGEKKEIFRFKLNGHELYLNPKGQGIRKALLRTPVNAARISSGFGYRRHPVLGYNKLHKGVDFAAPTGTPIYAAGDGKITYRGRMGSYGNFIRIRHNSTYSTAYAHLSRFSRLRKGQYVKQGQVIGYVGSTGRATGAHLHYEVIKYGKQVNPLKVQFQAVSKLNKKQLAQFRKTRDLILAEINVLPKEQRFFAKK